jgi:ankyrin repeat protein
MLRTLLAKGAALDAADAGGTTALMRAAEFGRAESLEALLKAGANRTLKDRQGRTAADLARENRQDFVLTLF